VRFKFYRSRKNQKVRVPEYTFLPLSLVHFGFCTNLVGYRFSSLNKVVERTARVVNVKFRVLRGSRPVLSCENFATDRPFSKLWSDKVTFRL
jgi:hypothetical protein